MKSTWQTALFVLALIAVLALSSKGFSSSSDTPCPFDLLKLAFSGTPVEQARCLLRPVEPYGKLGPELSQLPQPLESIIGQPCRITPEQFRAYLKRHNIREADLGGSLDHPLCRANDGDPRAPFARYLVIHDTSTPNYLQEAIPENINLPSWEHNDLSRWDQGEKSKAHVFINRLGESLTAVDFAVPWRGTKFELQILKEQGKGLFLHIELIQPRRSDPQGFPGNDAIAPEPGFTIPQLQRLAEVYIAASIRRGEWLIPAYHAAVDAGIPDAHDDPQNFDLDLWAKLLQKIINEMEESAGDNHEPLSR